jgi:hypothetical protein
MAKLLGVYMEIFLGECLHPRQAIGLL